MKPICLKIITITFCFLISFNLFSQNIKIRNSELSLSFGLAEYDIQQKADGSSLNFLDYFDDYPDYIDYGQIKIGYKFDFAKQMSADIKLILQDDLSPSNFDVSMYYHSDKNYGLGLGAMMYHCYISYFEEYHKANYPEYYLTDMNMRQWRAADFSFYISPMLKLIDNERLNFTLKCDVGLSSFLKEQTTFYLKRKLSNEKYFHYYDTKLAFQPYINSKIELKFSLLKIKTKTLGLLINSNFYYAKRNISYVHTTRQWTSDNQTQETVNPDKYHYSRFEMDFGLFFKW